MMKFGTSFGPEVDSVCGTDVESCIVLRNGGGPGGEVGIWIMRADESKL